ncbi:putative conserved oligomeric Golgi complex subunit 5 [Apostichopus japonicus]|uniref:Conserved oligomeric Golgi complex subunit 5 n=1 Tax=Stichopus japonicus TaxID=307972 RepID=A0A2G8L441_STIJA|nr:putative conserved oligomeric Golgi complex subunit 5 [Apostichopus japonicus]
MMQTRIHALQTAVDRIRSKVVEPYEKIVARTAQLRRLQGACDLLRRIIRILYLSKRLHGQLQGGAREITKAAQSLNELDYLFHGVDLSGIDIVEQDTMFIRRARKDIERQAQKMLHQGMETQNQTQVATSLQVFHNLGSLKETVEKVLSDCESNIRRNIKTALSVQLLPTTTANPMRGPGRASMPAPGNTAAFRATLWTNLEKLMDQLYATCGQIHHLQKVLSKKRDPVTHVFFMEELYKEKQKNILHCFWESLTYIVKEEFVSNANENTFIKQAFEGEYPKLLRSFNELWKRLEQFTVGMTSKPEQIQGPRYKEEEEDLKYNPEQALKESLDLFEKAYLSRSLSRLFDPINLAFPGGSSHPPSNDDIEGISKTVSSELSVASVDQNLSILIARNVAKTLKLYASKCEQMLCTDGEASQVIAPPSAGQTKNAAVVNSLYRFHQSVGKVLASLQNLPERAMELIVSAMQELVNQMSAALKPLLDSISDSIEAIILTMHNEDFKGAAPKDSPDIPCSLYMRELQGFISRVQAEYLSQFMCTDFILQSINPVASRGIELFIIHATLLRPLGEGGKMRLAADCAQMELALAPLCHRPSDLGRPYKLLRAFRPMLFQTPEHIVKNTTVGEIVPYSTVLQFLFSKAPKELMSPHEGAGWSISRYSQWLCEHPTEKERLALIRGTLEFYVQGVNARHGKEYASIYPLMLDLLQKGTAAIEMQDKGQKLR